MELLNYQELKEEKGVKMNDLFSTCLVFFAFSNDQFEKNKTPKNEGEKYVSIGHGGYMPQSKVQNLISGQKEIEKWYKIELKKTKSNEADILNELNNYECFYTGDIDDAVSALSDRYTKEEVQAVYKKNRVRMLEING